jgi:uncharacterized protein YrzB (UPF0473 family)
MLHVYSGKRLMLKLEVPSESHQAYLKYYLESISPIEGEEKLTDKVLNIRVRDFDKNNVITKVVNEFFTTKKEIKNLKQIIEKDKKDINNLVYKLYNLTNDEIELIENSI